MLSDPRIRDAVTMMAVCAAASAALGGVPPASADERSALAAFQSRVAAYVDLHRRIEGPVVPPAASNDLGEVQRVMGVVRAGLSRLRAGDGEGSIFSAEIRRLFRQRIARSVSRQALADIRDDLDEHTPPGAAAPRVNEPLPEDTPFVPIPPRLLGELPPLPPGLRYVVLGDALLLWDHHANMVVDVAPGLFDPATYDLKKK